MRMIDRLSVHSSEGEERLNLTRDQESSPFGQKTSSDGLSLIRQSLPKTQHFDKVFSHYHGLMEVWNSKTVTTCIYANGIRTVVKDKLVSVSVSIDSVLDFLAELYDQGLKYSAINSARSALSAVGIIIDGIAVGSHPLVIRFLRGVYNLRMPVSRYCEVWDVNKVLDYLRTLSPLNALNLKQLTMKLVMLIALTTASRSHSLNLLTIDNMVKEPSKYVLYYSGPLKQSRAGYKTQVAELCSYPLDKRLCVL